MTARTRNYMQDKGYDAAAAITKFRAVKFSAEETVTPVTAVTDVIAGIAQEAVSAGDITHGKGAVIAVEGDTEWEANAALAVGTRVGVLADGRCKAAAAAEPFHGWVVEPSGAAGERCRVHLALNTQPTV